MNRKRAILLLLAIWLGAVVESPAQPPKADRERFDQVRARAEKGSAEAQLELAALYANGIGTARDRIKAAKWHRKAADQGLALAQYQLGLDYTRGEGVKEDKMEGVQWIRKAAEQGLAVGQLALGQALLNGEGVHANGVEAVRWFRQASDQGLVDADYEIGKCYFDGAGVAKDIEEGLIWTRRAAERGFAAAQNSLGNCYRQGIGVPKDYIQAYKWFELAAAQDDEHADDIRVSLAGVEAVLTKEQVAQAQAMAREFKPAQLGVPPSGAAEKNTSAGQIANAGPPKGGTTNLSAEITQTGVVEVSAGDGDCEIFADGAFVGNPPAKLKLAAGPHVVVVRKSGFKEYRKEVQVGAGSQLTLKVTLEREASPNPTP